MKIGAFAFALLLAFIFVIAHTLLASSQINFGMYNTDVFLLEIGLVFAATLVIGQFHFDKGISTQPAGALFTQMTTVSKNKHPVLFYLLTIIGTSLLISLFGTLVNAIFYIPAFVLTLVFFLLAGSTAGVFRRSY